MAKTYEIDQFKISVSIPEGWQGLRGYLGRDLTLLAPKDSGKRETIFIEATNTNRVNLASEKKASSNYKKIKMEWLKKKAGRLESINLDKKLSFLKKDYLYREVIYEINQVKFIEGDLFLKCSSEVAINLSYLIIAKKQLIFKQRLRGILESLICEKK